MTWQTALSITAATITLNFWVWCSLLSARVRWLEEREGKIMDILEDLIDREPAVGVANDFAKAMAEIYQKDETQ